MVYLECINHINIVYGETERMPKCSWNLILTVQKRMLGQDNMQALKQDRTCCYSKIMDDGVVMQGGTVSMLQLIIFLYNSSFLFLLYQSKSINDYNTYMSYFISIYSYTFITFVELLRFKFTAVVFVLSRNNQTLTELPLTDS